MISRRTFLKGVSAAASIAALPLPLVSASDVLTVEQVAEAESIFLVNDAMVVKLWNRVLDHEAAKYVDIQDILGLPSIEGDIDWTEEDWTEDYEVENGHR